MNKIKRPRGIGAWAFEFVTSRDGGPIEWAVNADGSQGMSYGEAKKWALTHARKLTACYKIEVQP